MQQLWKGRLNLLASYSFLKKDPLFMQLIVETSPYINWLIDCGAFTNYQNRQARALGKKVTNPDVILEDYIAALKQHLHGKVWQYITLDVIRNKEATERNLQTMLDAGLRPMPVFLETYTAEKVQELTRINNRLCVAGGVLSNDHFIRKRYIDVYEASDKRAKIHALGFGRFPDVFQLPVSSYDSSSFTAGERYGALLRYSPRDGFIHINWQQLADRQDKKIQVLRKEFLRWLLDECDVSARALADPLYYRNSANIQSMTQVFGYLQFSQHCLEKGVDYFLAVSTRNWCSNIIGMLWHSNAAGFSYDLTREKVLQLIDLQKKPERWISELTKTVKEYTEWQILPHSL